MAPIGSSIDIMEESEVVLGHPLLRALGDVSLDEAMSMTHGALNQAQDVLHWESGDINDEHRCLLLWASTLMQRATFEKAEANVRQRHLDTREELLER
jgi:hypothetical protein